MKRMFIFLIVGMALLVVSSCVSAEYKRPCADVDLCTWVTDVNGSALPDYGLPLGSPDTSNCGLDYKTFWPVGSEANPTYAAAECTFDGSDLSNVMAYISVDNDIVACTLNEVPIFGYTNHTGCAPADPRDSNFSRNITSLVLPGENILVCLVKDYGYMSHFNSCVTGVRTQTPIVPEFCFVVGVLTVLGAVGTFFIVRKR